MQSHPQRWAIGFALTLGLATSAPAQVRNLSFQNKGVNDMQVKVVADKKGTALSSNEAITFKIKKGETVPVSINTNTLYSIRINVDGNDSDHATYGGVQGINKFSDYILVKKYEIDDLEIGPD